jgi:hypothetical protein
VTGRVVSEERGEGEDFVSLILRRPRDTKDADMTARYCIDSEDQEAARVWKMECETTKTRKGFGVWDTKRSSALPLRMRGAWSGRRDPRSSLNSPALVVQAHDHTPSILILLLLLSLHR